MTTGKRLLLIVSFLALSWIPPAVAGETVDVGAMIHSAATRSDHEALGAHFEERAADARADAKRHRAMAETYREKQGALVEKWRLDRHCDELAEAFERVAEKYEALATAHREIAKSMKSMKSME